MPFTLTGNLDFGRAFQASADLELSPVDGNAGHLTLAVTLPGLQPAVQLSRVIPATMNVALPGLQPAAQLAYDNNVWRGLLGDTAAAMQDSQPLPGGVAGSWQAAQTETVSPSAGWQGAAGMPATVTGHHQATGQHDATARLPWAVTVPLGQGAGARYHRMQTADTADSAHWQGATVAGSGLGGSWHRYWPQDRGLWTGWQAALACVQALRGRAQSGQFAPREWRIPWQAGQPLTGASWPIVIPPEPPPPPSGTADLNFLYRFLLATWIEFNRSPVVRLPVRRTYFVLHSIAMTRVSDGAELQFADLTLSSDTGSWGWSLSGNALGLATYIRLTTTPFTEINVHINGIDWRFLVTAVSHSRQFGKTGYSVTGMSPALALTAPLSDAHTRQAADPWTVQQLADQEVADTAWTVDWQAPNWLIPGGVWQYSQQTPLQVIGGLAEAAGALVQAERVNRIVQVRPRYPAWPWESRWAMPDREWPLALVTDLKKSPKPGTNYNAVYTAGTVSGGIMGYVKRAGTAGDRSPGAPLSHLLITHADAARSFGGTYLADQQDQTEVSFSTILGGDAPLVDLASRIDLTETGQPPLALLTQAVSLSVQRGNNAVTVTQSVKGVAF